MADWNPHISSIEIPSRIVLPEVTIPPTQAAVTEEVTQSVQTVAAEAAETGLADKFQAIWSAPWCPWAILGLFAVLLFWIAILLWRTRHLKGKLASVPGKTGPITSLRVGKVHGQGARDYQQDSFGISDAERLSTSGVLAVVADGMGGLQNGGEISSAAVEAILDGFLYSQGQGTPEQTLLTLTQWAVKGVNAMLGPDQYRKSGSTLAMGLIKDNALSWISIGDSRICLFRDGSLIPLTREHDYKQTLALQAVNGEISIQEVYTDKRKDGLISFLGMGQLEHIDFPAEPLALRPGDKVIFMSDGIYNALENQEILNALTHTPQEAAQALEEAIVQKHYQNQDNYTAVILGCDTGRSEHT